MLLVRAETEMALLYHEDSQPRMTMEHGGFLISMSQFQLQLQLEKNNENESESSTDDKL